MDAHDKIELIFKSTFNTNNLKESTIQHNKINLIKQLSSRLLQNTTKSITSTTTSTTNETDSTCNMNSTLQANLIQSQNLNLNSNLAQQQNQTLNANQVQTVPANINLIVNQQQTLLATNCSNCLIKFTVFRRKHQCKLCSKQFCSNCLNKARTKDVKICVDCFIVNHSNKNASNQTVDVQEKIKNQNKSTEFTCNLDNSQTDSFITINLSSNVNSKEDFMTCTNKNNNPQFENNSIEIKSKDNMANFNVDPFAVEDKKAQQLNSEFKHLGNQTNYQNVNTTNNNFNICKNNNHNSNINNNNNIIYNNNNYINNNNDNNNIINNLNNNNQSKDTLTDAQTENKTSISSTSNKNNAVSISVLKKSCIHKSKCSNSSSDVPSITKKVIFSDGIRPGDENIIEQNQRNLLPSLISMKTLQTNLMTNLPTTDQIPSSKITFKPFLAHTNLMYVQKSSFITNRKLFSSATLSGSTKKYHQKINSNHRQYVQQINNRLPSSKLNNLYSILPKNNAKFIGLSTGSSTNGTHNRTSNSHKYVYVANGQFLMNNYSNYTAFNTNDFYIKNTDIFEGEKLFTSYVLLA